MALESAFEWDFDAAAIGSQDAAAAKGKKKKGQDNEDGGELVGRQPKKKAKAAVGRGCAIEECSDLTIGQWPECGKHHRAKEAIHDDVFSRAKTSASSNDQGPAEEFNKAFGNKKLGI